MKSLQRMLWMGVSLVALGLTGCATSETKLEERAAVLPSQAGFADNPQQALAEATAQAQQQVRAQLNAPFAEPRYHSLLEQQLREKARQTMPAWALPPAQVIASRVDEKKAWVEVEAALQHVPLLQQIEQRMAELNEQLMAYRFMKHSGSRFEQLQQLVPALPLVEEYRRLRNWQLRLQPDARAQGSLAEILDRRITVLCQQFSVVIDPLVIEAQAHEAAFRDALRGFGIEVSAKGPDLHFEYNIELSDARFEAPPMLMRAEVVIKNTLGLPVTQWQSRIEAGSEWNDASRKAVIEALATEVFSHLTEALMQMPADKAAL